MPSDAVTDQQHTPFKHARAGRKAEKKQAQNRVKHGEDKHIEKRNLKAFSSKQSLKDQHYKADKATNLTHMPEMPRFTHLDAPSVVAVVGPPQSGKSTLIRSLVKQYTRYTLTSITGPITCVAGKQRRVTFLESSSDLNSMCDIAKVADVVILMMNGEEGFEMETFEFTTILHTVGLTRVIGVIAHLDDMKMKALKTRKKAMRTRFWAEVVHGAKMFFISGLESGSLYPSKEMLNLSKMLAVSKLRPQKWRTTHPCVLVDNVEDLTPKAEIAQNPACRRSIAFYGYIRGKSLKNQQKIHIPGVGDFHISELDWLPDPCAPPDVNKKTNKARQLNEKERKIHAPFCDIADLMWDAKTNDAYVKVTSGIKVGEGAELLDELHHPNKSIDAQIESQQLTLLSGGVPVNADDSSDDDNDDDDDVEGETAGAEHEVEDDVEPGEEDDDAQQGNSCKKNVNKPKPVVLQEETEDVDGEEDTENFFTKMDLTKDLSNQEEVMVEHVPMTHDWTSESVREQYRDLFVTGAWESAEGKDEGVDDVIADRTMEAMNKKKAKRTRKQSAHSNGKSEEATDARAGKKRQREEEEGQGAEKGEEENDDDDDPEKYKKLKLQKKKDFDTMYDTMRTKVSKGDFYDTLKTEYEQEANKIKTMVEEMGGDTEEMAKLLGFFEGLYVRCVVHNVPPHFMANFDPSKIHFLGGLLANEQKKGYIYVRVKRHRYYNKILKSMDPVCLSIGWRRLQSVPIFATEDPNGRHRYLKYTPEHMHCIAVFWGPVTPANTGLIMFPDMVNTTKAFRPCANGYVMQSDGGSCVVKKLKLTGVPAKIERNTVFIKNMFNSELEVSKFIGAKLQTVSGLRGTIKKAVPGKGGIFRATFEDKMLKSDIVFLKAWRPVEPPPLSNTITEKLGGWRQMQTQNALRRQHGVALPQKADSEYRKVTRRPKPQNTEVKIQQSLLSALPFAEKMKHRQTIAPTEKVLPKEVTKATPVVVSPQEENQRRLLAQLKRVDRHAVAHAKLQNVKRIKRKRQVEIGSKRKGSAIVDPKKRKIRKIVKKSEKKRGKTGR